jgi:uncharacterized protein YndB with AHSA1/START domain
MAEIRHILVINVSPEKVFRAVTEQEGLSSWWTNETIAKSDVGSVVEFRFGDRYHLKMQIMQIDKNRRLEWECLKGDDEWVGTSFIFDLERDKNSTKLRFTHGNWRQQTDFLDSCNYQWGYYLRSLKMYCETGEGTPFGENS